MMIKIFLVEDEIAIRKGIKNSIDWEKEGYEFVGEAGDGELAYPMILKTKPDILITDIKMPFMDGLQLSKLVRKELPATKILILSGYDEFEYAKEAIKLQVAEYLLKPISSAKLLDVLAQVKEVIRQEQEEKELIKKYREDMKENRELEKERFLNQIITQNLSLAQILETGESLGMDLSAPLYNILLLKITENGGKQETYAEIESALDTLSGVFSFRRGVDEWLFLLIADDAEKMEEYKAEVRFMRALFYYHALDFYRNIPMVTENDPVGSYIPPRYTPQQTFDYIESELKDCVGDMLPASTCPYGQASQGAAYTLLAKLYLNSEVYTGVAKYAECMEACKKVMDMGYSLESDYSKLFNADNDKRTNEIIFALPVSAEHTVSWGSSTYLVCGQLSMSNANQNVADFGATSGWSEFRLRPEFVDKFTQTDIDGSGDKRCKFFTNGQSKDVTSMTDETAGYLSEKWSNLKDDGTTASNTGDAGVDTDFPLFRLADVYLMYAECVVRLHNDWDNWAGGSDAADPDVIASRKQGAIYWINLLRERSHASDVWASNFADDDAFLQFILDERARELYHEGYRRTDLIRYGQFTTNKYIWQWKGGTHDGQAVDSKYNIYPIPNTELTANPNLHNDNY